MPTEAEFERTAEVLDARRMLEARLDRLPPAELEAFRQAVRRCYASSSTDDDASDSDAAAT